MHRKTLLATPALILCASLAAPAHAAVTISADTTLNMNCSSGTCTPTAAKAVLNASDLESYLSEFGNVRVTTTGSGVEANNIEVRAGFSSPDSTSLTLEAHKAITVNAAVSIGAGTAELELQSDTEDASHTISFGRKGHVTFGSLSDIFGINGVIFTLVGSVQGLAAVVAANPSGAYALANSYDASQDGTYASSPVGTPLTGIFEGLGNTISRLAIKGSYPDMALFSYIGTPGTTAGWVGDLRLSRARVSNRKGIAGILAAENFGILFGDNVAGTVEGRNAVGGVAAVNELDGTIAASISSAAVTVLVSKTEEVGGGIAGSNEGTISTSSATGNINVDFSGSAGAGGLVGANSGTIDSSFATGDVYASGGVDSGNGGLVGLQDGTVSNCYASGSVGAYGDTGGLIGFTAYGTTSASYSTGVVTGPRNYLGGFVGYDITSDGMSDAYWDTDTSGITDPSQGAGNIANDPGITGLTTEQLQSGLPSGFDPKIWAEDSSINNGLPYLINNPPPK